MILDYRCDLKSVVAVAVLLGVLPPLLEGVRHRLLSAGVHELHDRRSAAGEGGAGPGGEVVGGSAG